jgi:hypothetical protein
VAGFPSVGNYRAGRRRFVKCSLEVCPGNYALQRRLEVYRVSLIKYHESGGHGRSCV